MTAPADLVFEEAGSGPGQAADWTINTVATFESIAEYDGIGVETFEGWVTPYLFAFAPGDLTAAGYHSRTMTPLAFEGFEVLWSGNEFYSFQLGSLSTAEYATASSPANYESFEQAWHSNESYITAFSGGNLTVAEYDSGAHPVDGFEHWVSGYLTSLGSVTAATYDSGTQTRESFEGAWPLVMITI